MLTSILTEEEEYLAGLVSKLRQRRAEKDQRKDRYGFSGNGEEIHLLGVRCELAVCKALGFKWTDTPYQKNERDLPFDLEVRGRSKHWYELLIWPGDHADRLYLHVTKEVNDPEYRIHGGMVGEDAMKDCYWKKVTERKASYFVPGKDLMPIEQIIQLLIEMYAEPGT